jgi:hypothetical protein
MINYIVALTYRQTRTSGDPWAKGTLAIANVYIEAVNEAHAALDAASRYTGALHSIDDVTVDTRSDLERRRATVRAMGLIPSF